MESTMENKVDVKDENKRKMRPLKGTDIYLMTAIIAKIGVKNLIRCLYLQEMKEERKETEEDDADALGQIVFFAMIDVVIDRLEACEGPICKLLARLYDMQESEIRELGANEYIDMLVDVVKDENFVDFFKHAYESVKRMM